MIKKGLFLFCFITSMLMQAQVRLTNSIVLGAIKDKLDSIHQKIYNAASSGKLRLSWSLGAPREASEIFSDKKGLRGNEIDSERIAGPEDFRGFSFNFKRYYDAAHNRMSTEYVSVNPLYRIYKYEGAGGLNTDRANPYYLETDELKSFLTLEETRFLELIAMSYSVEPYSMDLDTVVFSNGYRGTAFFKHPEDSRIVELRDIKSSLRDSFVFSVHFNDEILERVSKVILFEFGTEIQHLTDTVFYSDTSFEKKASIGSTFIEYFELPGDDNTYISEFFHCYLKELMVYDRYCRLNLTLYSNDLESPLESSNHPYHTYFIKKKDLGKLIGHFQYEFLKLLFKI